MSATTSLTSTVAQRYATSLFELAQDARLLEEVEAGLRALSGLIDSNTDLKKLFFSVVFSANQQAMCLRAVVEKMGLASDVSQLLDKFLQLLVVNRRLSIFPQIVTYFERLARGVRGEVVAHITSARALSAIQETELQALLNQCTGKKVRLEMTIDATILGGLIIRLGSKQIDTSLKTQLSTLKLALKEVG